MMETMTMAVNRPKISYSGSIGVFQEFESLLLQSLPQEPCEWFRSHGRNPKKIQIGVTFVPFSGTSALLRPSEIDLLNLQLKEPIFHVFWTDCADLDTYKSQTKPEIEAWLGNLQPIDQNADWMIVLVELYDAKKLNKLLPRTTVLDKLRFDFGSSKCGDRIVSVFNPKKSENRYSESWRGLNTRIRLLLLVAYDKFLARIESYIRKQCEARHSLDWQFLTFLKLQESLAAIYESWGVYDEALLQYDELDTLLSQLIVEKLRTGSKETQTWLSEIARPLQQWHGLKLMEASVLNEKPTLLQLRTYLFSRQVQLLLLDMNLRQITERFLPFIFVTLNEIDALEIDTKPGSLECWALLNSLEVLQIVHNFKDIEQHKSLTKCQALIFEYCSEKLLALGYLCGLLPKQETGSEHLNLVVSLSAGMGDGVSGVGRISTIDRLKQAFVCKTKFKQLLLEQSQAAIDAFRRIGYDRSAALVLRNMAAFYYDLDDFEQSTKSLDHFLETLSSLKWPSITVDVHQSLLKICKKSRNRNRCGYICSMLASTPDPFLTERDRLAYFAEMLTYTDQEPLQLARTCFEIVSLRIANDFENGSFVQNSKMMLHLVIRNALPTNLNETKLKIDVAVTNNADTAADSGETKRNFIVDFDIGQNKQIVSASVLLSQNNKQSLHNYQASNKHVSNSSPLTLIDKTPKTLSSGQNQLVLNISLPLVGSYNWRRIRLEFANFEFTADISNTLLPIMVEALQPSVQLVDKTTSYVMGVTQIVNISLMNLQIKSFEVTSDSIKIALPNTTNDLRDRATVQLDGTKTNQTIALVAKAENRIETCDLNLMFADSSNSFSTMLAVPFRPLFRLETSTVSGSASLQYFQIAITLAYEIPIRLTNFELVTDTRNDVFEFLNDPQGEIKMQYVNDVSFLTWKIAKQAPSITEAMLVFEYGCNDRFRAPVTIRNESVLYEICETIEPFKDHEFCRCGFTCHLKLTITKICDQDHDHNPIMYEIVPQANIWGVCSKTSGIVDHDILINNENHDAIVLEIMPLASGMLPMPQVRISKYISGDDSRLVNINESQIYNRSESQQICIRTAAAAAATTSSTNVDNTSES